MRKTIQKRKSGINGYSNKRENMKNLPEILKYS